ncbi:zinc finger CCCH domain-containing protein 13 isoform X1 [Neodiprion fabricii]|uniref:zinc finger CCCH domain-containing protein 13 isoform X1 n=1 Tax=Neodiprion fabricii TaxID=2872261 RepID=UPI001ED905F0|nr:zinc finger CCCH domain-containing protein 13 isoform X1 [Neodiprion fabricii]XP_046422528.1 zinc finger CCCH domain-containing protein 13 isoform X1 [Neodiprion fabricii]XP_046422529.1 zinc finger CCCH domain-containing protein 13 isoform X1 [Neodiprion fabricii]
METEELTRLVDGIYKNILDKFNPGARQLINAGKAYLKALHGAAAASRVYVDALSRLARQAQLGTWGGSQDVGSALMRIVEVYKEIQEQELNILKAFYVDLLVPLETNLEKDTKVVQSEQKRFLQQHKTRSETYSKAAATIKKQRKKSRGASKSGLAMDKELKNMQILEEEKSKLDAFCEQSLKNAMTQERRRYGFVLERQCSLAKHYVSFHEVALAALHPSVDEWREVAGTREYLPQSVEDMFASRLRQVSFWPEDDENGGSELTLSSQLRKTRSMDSSCLELRLGPPPGNNATQNHGPPLHHIALSRARSEANLHASSLSLGPEAPETPPRPRSMAPASRSSGMGGVGGVGTGGGWGDAPLARALFAYLSSGENQLSFLEGDLIALMGDRQKGWQFGENLRTQSSGWFPLAYTEIIIDETLGSPSRASNSGRTPEPRVVPPCKPPPSRPPVTPGVEEGTSSNSSHTPTNMSNSNSSQTITTPTSRQAKSMRPSGTLPAALAGGRRVQPPVPPVPPPQAITSLHSSNDSGFSNEPPVHPDIDYSDDEAISRQRRKPRAERIADADRVQGTQQQHAREDGGTMTKEWQNDSWKTIPKDENSWQLYKNAMDLWDNVDQGTGGGDKPETRYHQHVEREREEADTPRIATNPRAYARNSVERSSKAGGEAYERNGEYSSDYEGRARRPRERPNPNQRNKFRDEPASPPRYAQRRTTKVATQEQEYKSEKQSGPGKYGANEYTPRYENKAKKYYEDDVTDGNEQSGMSNVRRGYKPVSQCETPTGYDEDAKPESDSDEESTVTLPETGRKVEHIAQKLEQTAQKYARGLSPAKFVDPGTVAELKEEYKDSQDDAEGRGYDRERERERERYFERERNLEKNRRVERASSRRFDERPRPPFEEAPDRPRLPPYRERRYSEKEEIYGETVGRGGRENSGVDGKDRGYESNFETKLERSKVAEKLNRADQRGQSPLKFDKNAQKIADHNDTNYNNNNNNNSNNTLQKNEKRLTSRHGMSNFETDGKGPKLVKRTKSFWRFRRDSDVLEGMALWQHRSLVDIPKMLKREEARERREDHERGTSTEDRDHSPGGRDPEGGHRAARERPRDRERGAEEPKPAERIHKPERSGEQQAFSDDFPTPAERPKVSERSEYRMQQQQQQQHEERAYFVGNISRKAILENERKRSLEAKQNMVVAELKVTNETKKSERRKKAYGDDDDGLIQNFSDTEASDEESTYSCIVVKDQVVAEKTLLPRTKLRKDGDRDKGWGRERERDRERERERNTCGPWYDLWGVDPSVKSKKQ